MCARLFYWYLYLWLSATTTAKAHLASHVSTPANKVEQFCVLAESCVHDTIPVCGKADSELRTFMDLCDLLEFVCDTNKIFIHIEDTTGCPIIKKPNI